MKYIAYGSNTVQEQMAFRCPDARLIGTGYIAGAWLEFYLHATVEKTGDQRNRVPVAVWEINDRDERSLDRYEGFPSYYIKERWPVHMSDGSQIEGMIYIMKMIRQSPPHSAYYKGMHIPGAAHHVVAHDRCAPGRDIVQGRQLFQLAVDSAVEPVSLAQIFFCGHFAASFLSLSIR